MCVMSMVYDHFSPQIPTIDFSRGPMWTIESPANTDWMKILDDFKAARDAAAIVDAKTGQTDCIDPEKQKLEERVAQLEKLLADSQEFQITRGGMVEPGTYRLIDGKLYRLV